MVILEPQEEGYTVRCLELPGAISQGETREEALANIKEAIELVLEVLSQELGTDAAWAQYKCGQGTLITSDDELDAFIDSL